MRRQLGRSDDIEGWRCVMKKICVLLLLTILTAGCGYTRKSNSMSSAPAITALMPNSATPGQAFNLTVNGSNFTILLKTYLRP
jgi:hypothetical protein